MLDVKPGQIWKVCSCSKREWRRVRVVNVVLDAVELEYLDMPEGASPYETFAASRYAMLETASQYQFVAKGVPPASRRRPERRTKRCAHRDRP
jgi:hypothetical protein